MSAVHSRARTWCPVIWLQSLLSATSLCAERGQVFQDQENHSGNPKVLARDGIMGVLGDQTAEGLSSSLAISKEPVLGPYTHTLLGTFVG